MLTIRRFGLLFVFVALALTLFARTGQAAPPPFLINEILVGNAGTNLDPDLTNYSSWIELRNTTGSAINLTGYKLESWPDGATTPDSVLLRKLNVPANGYLLLWADETRKGNHIPFELDMDGGELRLTAPDGSFDHVDFTNSGRDQSMDVSYGRNAGDNWAYFDQPTPGADNTTPDYPSNDGTSFTALPEFSIPGGLHTGSIAVEIATATPVATIRYTLDGSRPTTSSPAYTGPIAINATTVLRARAWADGLMVSPTHSATYLFDIPTNVPIISIVTDNANLFDPKIGIYVTGNSGNQAGPNFNRSWERPANIEFFEMTGPNSLSPAINQEVGLEIHGHSSRYYPQKSFEIKARKAYGDNDMDYAFFGDKPMTSYKRLILRNGGNDNQNAFMRDALLHNLSAQGFDLDRQAYRPVVLYLNGAYWGLYNMREKMDEDYVENNYGLDEDAFDMLEIITGVVNGDLKAWKDFYNYINRSNVASPAVYETINSQMDVNSFIDYIIIQTYAANTDWPRNNTRWWNDYGEQYKWRWVMRDLDYALLPRNLKRDMIIWTMRTKGPTGTVFTRLWNNTDFRQEFAQRYAAHLNTTFLPPNVISLINSTAVSIRPEMPAHIARWGRPATLAAWEKEVQILRDMAAQRPFYARETLRKRIGNPADATLTVNVVGNGGVLVAGVAVPDGYSAPHFRNIPMTLTAVPEPGQLFAYWEETGETSAAIALPFAGDTTRTAVFESEPPPPPPPAVVINELNFNPPYDTDAQDDLYEFMELVNTGTEPADLSGFTFTSGIVYTFPPGTSIDPGEYILLVKLPVNFTGQGYDTYQWTEGSLSNGGETITLIDTFGQVVDSLTYDDVAPWPAEPDGGGPSLSLTDPLLANDDPAHWSASSETGGTPGAVNFP